MSNLSMSKEEKTAIFNMLKVLYAAEVSSSSTGFLVIATLKFSIDDTAYTYIAKGETWQQAEEALMDKFCDAIWTSVSSIIKALCIGVKTHVESTNSASS